MKLNLFLAGFLIAGAANLFAAQTAESILLQQSLDTPFTVNSVAMDNSGNNGGDPMTKANANDSGMEPSGSRMAFLQLSLTPTLALHPRTTVIDGLSLNIWGENPQHGVAIGVVNGSTGASAGFSLGIVNYDQTYKGVQWGIVNISRQYFVGLQRGWLNISCGDFYGAQVAFVNYSQNTTGLQLGWVNYARNLTGVQIGLVNIAMNNPWFTDFPSKLTPVFPIVNWSF
ncbi:MAG TPA: hypothetical protein VFV23_07700 [Verrucomicrobiae bacterium]|nr:hypothetical protein [Verrucomicrobiae bacterium]